MEVPICLAIDTTENWNLSDTVLGKSELAIENYTFPDGRKVRYLLVGDGEVVGPNVERLRAKPEFIAGLVEIIKELEAADRQLQENIDRAEQRLQENMDQMGQELAAADRQLQENIEQTEQRLQENMDQMGQELAAADKQLQENIDQAEQRLQENMNQMGQELAAADKQLQENIEQTEQRLQDEIANRKVYHNDTLSGDGIPGSLLSVRLDYDVTAGGLNVGAELTANGTDKIFSLPENFLYFEVVLVQINGLGQRFGTDYQLDLDAEARTIEFFETPEDGDIITLFYTKE
jgi:hypothetical protein